MYCRCGYRASMERLLFGILVLVIFFTPGSL
jgi:hypothetical protein